MLPRRPRLRLDPTAPPSKPPTVNYQSPHDERSTKPTEEGDYPHTSVFRSPEMEIHVRSPAMKVVRRDGFDAARSLPVFGDHNKVEGTVLMDVGLCSVPGRLTITMEGVFEYLSPFIQDADLEPTKSHRHVFLSSSVTFPVGEITSPRSTSSLRETFTASVRSRMTERRPSQPNLKGALRPFRFCFDLPRTTGTGEELPPSFASVTMGECDYRGRHGVERAEVSYKVVATWALDDGNRKASIEAPILYQPDVGFESLDGLSLEPESWMEIPLKSDRPIPCKCAVALPDPLAFPRSGTIPHYVVFTTTPRSPALAREIASDATISVSLVRQVNINALASSPSPSPTTTSASSSEEFEETPRPRKRKFLKRRTVKSAPPTLGRSRRDKPLPQLPAEGASETRTLHTEVVIGFPKRPRMRMQPHQRHPSLDEYASLPDGLYKGKMPLDRHILPAINWDGLSVKYYIDVSVVFGQDEMRARVPVRIT
ncbi:hypothetical protein CERSUDRAFT_116150 [Gelatoporia subvermispora B]|uniref:Uncharacterized protein n=1 Tax=Ceriporiopsis subvermispora (strain B) TaxID=914234 RepID=M2QTI2_CERS8|nr:hypothetical protein CERSUDRAFT_116150 [Gelatoporia subvermispora B]